MSKGVKIFLGICAGLFVGGIVLAGAGFLMGGHIVGMHGHDGGVLSLGHRIYNTLADGEIEAFDERRSFEEIGDKVDAFQSLKVEAGEYSVKFVPDDHYWIRYKYDQRLGMPGYAIESGVLTISDPSEDISLKHFKGGYDGGEPLIEIHYPVNHKFENIDIDCQVGIIDLSNVAAKRIAIDLAVGQIKGTDVISDGLDLEIAVGDITLAGTFTGSNDIECQLGAVEIATGLSRSQYTCDLEATLGSATVDGAAFNEADREQPGVNHFTVECETGSITLRSGTQTGSTDTQVPAPMTDNIHHERI